MILRKLGLRQSISTGPKPKAHIQHHRKLKRWIVLGWPAMSPDLNLIGKTSCFLFSKLVKIIRLYKIVSFAFVHEDILNYVLEIYKWQ